MDDGWNWHHSGIAFDEAAMRVLAKQYFLIAVVVSFIGGYYTCLWYAPKGPYVVISYPGPPLFEHYGNVGNYKIFTKNDNAVVVIKRNTFTGPIESPCSPNTAICQSSAGQNSPNIIGTGNITINGDPQQ